MKTLRIGDVTITSIIERDGPWRKPEDMFPAYDPEVGERHLADARSGGVRSGLGPHGHHLPDLRGAHAEAHGAGRHLHRRGQGLSRRRWISRSSPGSTTSSAAGLRFEDITTSSARTCTSTTPAGTRCCATAAGCRRSRTPSTSSTRASTPTGRRRRSEGENPPGNVWTYNCRPIVEAGQALLVDDDYELDDTFSLTPTPGHSPCHCCVDIRSKGQHAVVTGDMMHHALQCREPEWSTIFDTDTDAGGAVAPQVPRQVADTAHAGAADPLSRTRPSAASRRTATASTTSSCDESRMKKPAQVGPAPAFVQHRPERPSGRRTLCLLRVRAVRRALDQSGMSLDLFRCLRAADRDRPRLRLIRRRR